MKKNLVNLVAKILLKNIKFRKKILKKITRETPENLRRIPETGLENAPIFRNIPTVYPNLELK